MSPTSMVAAIALCASSAGAGEHLLAGATAFREGRYAEALVEFRLAERLGEPAARPYAGAVLVKLGRHEEAVEAFGAARPEEEDSLLTYFRALALRGAGLPASADAALAAVGERAGPRIGAEVQRIRAELAPALAVIPAAGDIDALLARARALREEGRPALASALCLEASLLAARRPDRHRASEAARGAVEPAETGRQGS